MNSKVGKKNNRIFLKNDKLTEEALNACQVLHIDTEMLFSKPKEYFNKGNANPSIVEIRNLHYEEKRKTLMNEIEQYLTGVDLRNTNNSFMRR